MHTTLALAFSGGLDTSYCVPRLAELGYAVHTVYVNTGGSSAEERAAIRRQAEAVGAVRHHEVDARHDVFNRFVRFLIQGNVLRGEVYPLSVAAERTQQALSVVETARRLGANAVAHGSPPPGAPPPPGPPALPVPAKAGAYSINRGLWGTTWGGGWTHDTWAGPPGC